MDGFIDVLHSGPVQMWNIPVLKAGLALLEVFKVFQRESIYCLGEKKAVVVLDSETPASSFHQDGAIFCTTVFGHCAEISLLC